MNHDTTLAHALGVMVLNHRIREWLEANDPKALEQATDALIAYEPAYAARLAEARLHRIAPQCDKCGTDLAPGFSRCADCTSIGMSELDEDDMVFQRPDCPVCAVPSVLLGWLGSSARYRCRICGSEFTPKQV